ncbi:hypothetical protein D8M35_01740 [Curtobacterium sp. HSID17257]|nr:hypothetical protein D8M35_01740 [Curtobacterium sp. HSID17257]
MHGGSSEAMDDLHVVRNGLEARLRSVVLGRHPRSARFSTSRGRVDGVVDSGISGRRPHSGCSLEHARCAVWNSEIRALRVVIVRMPGDSTGFRIVSADPDGTVK